MDAQTKARYEELAKISKAMAHPSRMFIIEKLNEQEYCVNELTEMIGADGYGKYAEDGVKLCNTLIAGGSVPGSAKPMIVGL